MSNTSEATQRIMYDLAASDEKGYKEYGTTIDRTDYDHAAWLKEAYDECLDMSKYLRRALDTHEDSVPVREVSDFLLEINASIQATMGVNTSTEEKARNKRICDQIIAKCEELDPRRFSIKNPSLNESK
jgi:hypothetical protein